MTLSEISWLSVGALLGAILAYALPFGINLVARLIASKRPKTRISN